MNQIYIVAAILISIPFLSFFINRKVQRRNILIKAREYWDETMASSFEKSQMLVGVFQQTLFTAYVVVKDYNDTEITKIYFRFPNRISFRLKDSNYWVKETKAGLEEGKLMERVIGETEEKELLACYDPSWGIGNSRFEGKEVGCVETKRDLMSALKQDYDITKNERSIGRVFLKGNITLKACVFVMSEDLALPIKICIFAYAMRGLLK